LFQITLMVFLGAIKHADWLDCRHDRLRQLLLTSRAAGLGGSTLRVVMHEDHGPVLTTDVRALAVTRGRIVIVPENVQQARITDLLRIELDLHGFGVAGRTTADLLVTRVFDMTADVTHGDI